MSVYQLFYLHLIESCYHSTYVVYKLRKLPNPVRGEAAVDVQAVYQHGACGVLPPVGYTACTPTGSTPFGAFMHTSRRGPRRCSFNWIGQCEGL